MTSAAPLIPAERPEPAIKASSAPGTLFTMGRVSLARSGRTLAPATRRAEPVVSGARARRSPSHPLGSESSGCVALKDVCKPRTQILLSPAPLFPLASDGRPRTLSADAGGAKMRGRCIALAGRARFNARVSYAKSAQAVTLFPSQGRSARWNRLATHLCDEVVASNSVRRAVQPPRTPRASDGIGAGPGGLLLPPLPGLVTRAEALLVGADEDFHRPFLAAVRAFFGALDRT